MFNLPPSYMTQQSLAELEEKARLQKPKLNRVVTIDSGIPASSMFTPDGKHMYAPDGTQLYDYKGFRVYGKKKRNSQNKKRKTQNKKRKTLNKPRRRIMARSRK